MLTGVSYKCGIRFALEAHRMIFLNTSGQKKIYTCVVNDDEELTVITLPARKQSELWSYTCGTPRSSDLH